MQIHGSGASFPNRIYSIWFLLFNRDNNDLSVTYTAKGSGGGIRDFIAHKTDFGASDAAMSEEEIAKVEEGVQLLPMTAGEVVLAYNLYGIKNLKIPRSIYPDIFLGKIKKWNHPKIIQANPGVSIPDLNITVISRADSSGTTFVFTKHLSAISKTFAQQVGYGKKVKWPAEVTMMSSQINAGVASIIKQVEGAIGYVDYGFAKLVALKMAHLQNKAGSYIAPGIEGGQASLAQATLPDNMVAWLPDPDGADSYPITTYTWMMFYKQYQDPEKAEQLRNMVNYTLDYGQKLSLQYGYIPLPDAVIERVRTAAENIR